MVVAKGLVGGVPVVLGSVDPLLVDASDEPLVVLVESSTFIIYYLNISFSYFIISSRSIPEAIFPILIERDAVCISCISMYS